MMVWTIPLTEVAGVLVVSFTQGVPAMLAPASDTPVQRPGTIVPAPGEPSDPPASDPPASDPIENEPTPPALPPDEASRASDPTEGPPPPQPASPPAPQATDDEDAPIVAEKQPARERVLRPTDNRRFFHMTAGGATANSVYSYYGGGSMDFQIEGIIGSHAKRFPNFGGGSVVQFRKGFWTELTFAGRLLWDKPLSKSFAIYSSTDFTFGVNVPIAQLGYFYPGIPSALFGIGWSVKMILFERLLLSFRPIGPNLVAPSFYNQLFVRFRWDVGGGIGVVW